MIAKQMQANNKKGFRAGQGATFTLNIEFNDSSDSPIDLTGHDVDFEVYNLSTRAMIDSHPATLDTGNIAIEVSDEETAAWPAGKQAYRVVHTDPSGREFWILYGPLQVESGFDV